MHEKNRSSVFSVLLPVGYLHVGGDCSLSPEFRRITFLLPVSFHCGMMNSHSLLLRRPFCFIQPESLELSSAGSMNLNQVYQSQLLHASFFTQLPEIIPSRSGRFCGTSDTAFHIGPRSPGSAPRYPQLPQSFPPLLPHLRIHHKLPQPA